MNFSIEFYGMTDEMVNAIRQIQKAASGSYKSSNTPYGEHISDNPVMTAQDTHFFETGILEKTETAEKPQQTQVLDLSITGKQDEKALQALRKRITVFTSKDKTLTPKIKGLLKESFDVTELAELPVVSYDVFMEKVGKL